MRAATPTCTICKRTEIARIHNPAHPMFKHAFSPPPRCVRCGGIESMPIHHGDHPERAHKFEPISAEEIEAQP